MLKYPSFRLPLHLNAFVYLIILFQFDIYKDKPNDTCL